MSGPKYFCSYCGVSVNNEKGQLILINNNLELCCAFCLTSLREKGVKFNLWPSGEIKDGKVIWFDGAKK